MHQNTKGATPFRKSGGTALHNPSNPGFTCIKNGPLCTTDVNKLSPNEEYEYHLLTLCACRASRENKKCPLLASGPGKICSCLRTEYYKLGSIIYSIHTQVLHVQYGIVLP